MIIDFTVRNFGPFKDAVTFSMQGTALSDSPAYLVDVEGVKGGVLTSAIVLGANASGKSYLLKALSALKGMVYDAYEEGYRYKWYEPFRLDKECSESPVDLSIRMVIDGIRYDYSVSYLSDRVVSECLKYYPLGKPRTVFNRTGPKEYTGRIKKRVASMTSISSTYLTVAAKYNDDICNEFRNAVRFGVITLGPNIDSLVDRSLRYTLRNEEAHDLFVEALGAADLGIVDFTHTEEDVEIEKMRGKIPPDLYNTVAEKTDTLVKWNILLRHYFPAYDPDDDRLLFPMEIESMGTRALFGLMGPLMDALSNGCTLVIDEFGTHLHPLITRWIMKRFTVENNPEHAQLIVNTHDVGLLDGVEDLRRDQVWFVNKSRTTGSSELYSLSDYKGIRQNTDILVAYLFGRFDAVPEPSDEL